MKNFKNDPYLLISGVNAILYKCPLIGDQVLPKDEMLKCIRTFLYSQLDEEPGLTSCLIIRTFNKDQEKVQLAIDTLCKVSKYRVTHIELSFLNDMHGFIS